LIFLIWNTIKYLTKLFFPAAAFFEIINETSKQISTDESITIQNFSIHNALLLEDGKNKTVQILIQQEIGNKYLFSIDSINEDESINHCKGVLQFKKSIHNINDKPVEYNRIITKQQHYDATIAMDLQYDTSFQLIEQINSNQNIFNSIISTNHQIQQETAEYNFHPTLLDACFQTFLTAIYSKEKDVLYIPASCKEFQFIHPLNTDLNIETIVEIKSYKTNQIIGNIKILDEQKNILAIGNGFAFERVDKQAAKTLDDIYYTTNWEKITLKNNLNSSEDVLIIHNNSSAEILYQNFLEHNIKCNFLDIASFSVNDFQQALSAHKDSKKQIIFILDKLQESNSIEEIQYKQERQVLAVVNLIQAINQISFSNLPRLWLVTQQGQQIIENEIIIAEQHQVSAFCRVAWNEHYELKPSTIDIINDDALRIIPLIIAEHNNENEIAIRNNEVYVSRLVNIRIPVSEKSIIHTEQNEFCVGMNEIGVIDNLSFKQMPTPTITSSDVLVEVKAVGVNFMNLMSVLGITPGKKNGFATLGIECTGIVQQVGNKINHLKVGDRVMGMAYHSLASHVAVNGNALRKIPEYLSYQEAATIPAVFLTAYYSLVELAKLKSGDKVLIHAATGGVGLAAIQIAKYVGAEVYATAGSNDKRDYLKSLGIQNIYDSRSIEFYEQILNDTHQQGVDIVLNSLTGDAMYKSMQLLKGFGRFIEIGKKDIFENSRIGLDVFKNGLSYHMVDVEKMLFEKPEFLGELLQEIILLIDEHKLHPLEKTIFPLQQVKEAFRYMNASKHIGKVVIDFEHKSDIEIESLAVQFNKNATYLLTGGTGGIGLTFVEWMLNNNATNFILINRNKPSIEAQNKIDTLIAKGANINCIQCNISDKNQLKTIIDNIDHSLPLKGIFHLAGILEDASIQNIHPVSYQNVLTPKIAAYNLHVLTQHLTLDYFVLFSSSAVLFASIGQAAYVSANAFMDALALNRRSNNLPALSIQYGTVADVGLAATNDNRGDRLREEGVSPLQPQDCTTIFTTASVSNNAVIGAFYFDVQKWKNNYSSAKFNPYFDQLSIEIQPTLDNVQITFLEELKRLNGEHEIQLAIEDKLKETISIVTKVNILNIDTESTFKSLGIDSLMSVQLKNKLEKVFAIALSVTAFWTYPSIKKYAKFLTTKLAILNEETKEEEIEYKEETTTSTNNLDNFNIDSVADDDISRLLDEELKNL
jgi:NADPH:quinone reductase-like Zn-dependent oxidoreductase/acyl carrier protein